MEFEDHVPEEKRSRKVTLLLAVLPVWLLASAIGALWLYFHLQEKEAEIEQPRVSTPVSTADVEAMMGKVMNFVGERNSSSPAAAEGLKSMMAMVDGSLGPGNTGYPIERLPTSQTSAGAWPIVVARLRGQEPKAPAVWVVVPCDSSQGKTGAVRNASGVITTMAVAKSMAEAKLPRSVYFAFVPHYFDPSGPAGATAETLFKRMAQNPASSVIVVDGVGTSPDLRKEFANQGSADLFRSSFSGDADGRILEAEALTPLLQAKAPIVLLATTLSAPLPAEDTDRAAPRAADLVVSAEALRVLIGTLAAGSGAR